ncbi:type VI secretion system-associated protein TagF [Pseudoduganella violaceinigra]|uniref:type VI secretion system-associated protein TagF n=1 Tax=Pseudoduganella violaceinigra TaxID=246602 RepID=UPI0005567CFA|nr:type VI secretion system-associated protein TagF [Pseudoduganella violaceinigra]
MHAASPPLPGWYGKIPALGDFASRRLPPGFIAAWDAWLQEGMAASRSSLKERWLETYLNGPLWNFALLPGVCGESAWAGVMMPSVDKVGRHFPLTLAVELAPVPEVLASLLSAQHWFCGMEQLALECLDVGFDPAVLEERLAGSAFPVIADGWDRDGAQRIDRWWSASAGTVLSLDIPSRAGLCELFWEAGSHHYGRTGRGKSLWWSEPASGGAIQLLAFSGLPAKNDFEALLGDAG